MKARHSEMLPDSETSICYESDSIGTDGSNLTNPSTTKSPQPENLQSFFTSVWICYLYYSSIGRDPLICFIFPKVTMSQPK